MKRVIYTGPTSTHPSLGMLENGVEYEMPSGLAEAFIAAGSAHDAGRAGVAQPIPEVAAGAPGEVAQPEEE